VIDASPLIYFARIDAIQLAAKVLGEIQVPPAVFEESVTAGRAGGYADAEVIAEAIAAGWLQQLTLDSESSQIAAELGQLPSLGLGECETIAHAKCQGLRAVLEDRRARRVATDLGVSTLGCIDVLYLALIRRKIEVPEFRSLLRAYADVTGLDSAALFEHESLAESIDTGRPPGPDESRRAPHG
jgi:predicted nucleic acid-binding protein